MGNIRVNPLLNHVKLLKKLFFWKHLSPKRKRYFQLLLGSLFVVLIPLAVIWIQKPPTAKAAWLDESWLYRQKVAITNSAGSNQTEYQVKVTLATSTLITASKVQSDCDDIRITDANGKILPHWIETGTNACNTTTTAIWTKVPSITTSGATVYLYYGNPTSPSGQVPEKVFEFFDDFSTTPNNGSKWTTNGSPSVSSGELSLLNSSGIVSNATQSTNDGAKALGFRAKTASTTVNTAHLGYSNTNNLSSTYYNDDAANIVLGPEETYTNSVATTNEKAFWKLEETTSTDANQFKASGYYDTGKLSQAVGVYGNAAGTTGSKLSFNRGAQISGNNYEHININQGTISFWVQGGAWANDGLRHILFDGGNVDQRIVVWKDTDNNLSATTRSANDDGGWQGIMFGFGISSWTSTSTWHHLAFVWNKNNVVSGSVYAGGYHDNSFTVGTSGPGFTYIASTKQMFIGSRWDGTKQANTLIDDFAIYDRVLSSTEISNIYNSGTGATAITKAADPSLKFYASLDGSGTLSPVTYNAGTKFDWTAYNSSTNTNGTMLSNGLFESATAGAPANWTAVGTPTLANAATADILYDTRSQKITNTAANDGLTQTSATVAAGDDLYVSAWVKSDGTNAITLAVQKGSDSSVVTSTSTTSSSWTKLEFAVEVPAAETTVNVSLTAAGTTTVWYADNIWLGKSLVNNGGMEGTYSAGTGSNVLPPGFTEQGTLEGNELTDVGSGSQNTGSHALGINGEDGEGVKQTVSLTANTYYLVSYWAKSVSGSAAASIQLQTNNNLNFNSTLTTSWARYSHIGKATSTTSDTLYIISSNGTLNWIIDDLSIIPLDNVSTSFQAWAPVADSGSNNNSNSLSVHGSSTGVASTTSGARSNGYTFGGSSTKGYLRQKVYAMNLGSLSYSGNTLVDDGQTFTSYKTSSGNAAYMIVITNSDNTTSWGYIGNNSEAANTVTVYNTIARSAAGWLGTSPTGKTPVGYEIRKTDFQITGAMTIGVWLNGSGASAIGKSDNTGNLDWGLYGDSGVFRFQAGASNLAVSNVSYNTSGAWRFVVGVFDPSAASGQKAKIYIDGVYNAQSGSTSSMTDTLNPLLVGTGFWGNYWNGTIDSPFILTTALSAAQVQALYNASGSKYGIITDNGTANGFTESSTNIDSNTYHNFEITQKSSSTSLTIDGGSANTSSTNSPNSAQYIRFDNSDASNAVTLDWVYVRKTAATEPTIGSPSSEEISPGPIAHFKFDEGGGTSTKDSSSTKLTGNITGASWQNENMCVSGKCLWFDGTDDEISISNAPILTPSDNWSVSFWSKSDPTKTTWNGVIYFKAGEGWGIYARHDSSAGRPFLYTETTSTGATNQYFYGNATQSYNNDWKHFTLTKSSTTYKWYINGLLDNTQNKSTEDVTNNTGSTWKIGFSYSQRYKGFLDDIKVYKYARSAAQVKSDYQQGSVGLSSKQGSSSTLGAKTQEFMSEGLAGYWKFDESSGNATDSSGNGNTLTNTNIATYVGGKFGNAAHTAAASSQYFTIDSNSTLQSGNNSFTISAWVYMDSAPATTDMYIVSKNDNNTSTAREYTLHWRNSGGQNRFQSYITNSSGTTTTVTADNFGAPSINTWYFVVAWYDKIAQTINIQVNNGAVNSTAYTSDVNSTVTPFLVGYRTNGAGIYSGYWDGRIEEVRLYKRALSNKERSDLYNFAPGPSGYWNFDERTGTTANDISGNGLNGSLGNGSVPSYPTWTSGKVGQALSFDGTNDYVQVSDNAILDPSVGMSLSTWIKLNALPSSGSKDYIIIDKWNGTGDQRSYEWDVLQSDNKVYFYASANGIATSVNIASNNALTVGRWYHLEVTYDGTTVRMYVDGFQQTATATVASIYPSTTNFVIGGNDSGATSNPFNGIIDDVKIYNYGRSSKQVIEDMNSGHPAVGSPIGSPVGYWKFEEGYGTTTNNVGNGGSSLTGTLTSIASPATIVSGWQQTGKFGKSVGLDGSNDYIDFTNTASYVRIQPPVTVSAWIKVNTIPSGSGASCSRYWSIYTADDTGYGYGIHLNSASKFRINRWYSGGSSSSLGGNTAISTGVWYHVVGVLTSTSTTIYLNGAQDNTNTPASGTIFYNSGRPPVAGKEICGSDTFYFPGQIDDLKVYNYALTADEVKTDYNKGSSMVLGSLSDTSGLTGGIIASNSASAEYCIPGDTASCNAPTARWDFEEKSGTSAYDKSGNNYTGTLTSGPTWTTGKIGGGINFDGTDGKLIETSKALSSFITNSAGTIEVWMKPTGSAVSHANVYQLPAVVADVCCAGGYVGIFRGNYTGGGGGDGIYIFNYDTGNTFVKLSYNVDEWVHIAWVHSGGKLYAYKNGVLAGSTDSGNTGGLTYNLRMGDNGSSNPFNGIIDQVRTYNYARSASQISWDYNRGKPVGHWKFDECQGTTAYDSSGNNNSGTITIGLTPTQTTAGTCGSLTPTPAEAWSSGRIGKRNYSLKFDGTDDYITMGDPSSGILDFSSALSIGAWVKRGANGVNHVILSKSDFYNSGSGYRLYLDTNNKILFRIGNSPSNTEITSTSTIADTNWHHVIATYNGAKMKIYLDGREDKSQDVTGDVVSNAYNFVVGVQWYNGAFADYFNGQIDDVRAYNYPLTATQVKELYNQGAVNYGPSSGAP